MIASLRGPPSLHRLLSHRPPPPPHPPLPPPLRSPPPPPELQPLPAAHLGPHQAPWTSNDTPGSPMLKHLPSRSRIQSKQSGTIPELCPWPQHPPCLPLL